MKSLDDQLAFYRSYHTTAACRATHYLGVPLVTFSILIPMDWFSLPMAGYLVPMGWLFVGITLGYYFLLSPALAMAATVLMVPICLAAQWSSYVPRQESAALFAASFISGWIFQLVGHAIEGKRPALMDNFFQAVFTAPLFLMAEAYAFFGWKGPLRKP